MCVLLQYDKDESGTIDFDEFLDMAKVGSRASAICSWFGKPWRLKCDPASCDSLVGSS